MENQQKFACTYCGKGVPEAHSPHCGEVGHTEPLQEPALITLERTTIQEIKDATALNDHTEALLLGTRALRLDWLTEQVGRIQRDQRRRGEISHTDYATRQTLYHAFMAKAKRCLSSSDYKALHDAY